MLRLGDLQTLMQQAILEPGPSGENQKKLAAVIEATESLSTERRLAIYRDTVFTNLSSSLVSHFPVVAKLLGPTTFRQLALAYIVTRPSHSANIHNFGEQFSAFLADASAKWPEFADKSYLADIARLEWVWHQLFFAATDGGINLEELQKVPQEQQGSLRFTLNASAQLLHLDGKLVLQWIEHSDELKSESVKAATYSSGYLLCWRSGFERRVEALTVEQWQLLQFFTEGLSLDEICEQPLEFNLGGVLAELVSHGWLSGFTL